MEQQPSVMDRITQERVIKKVNEVISFADTLKAKLEEIDSKMVSTDKKIEEVQRIATLAGQIKKAEEKLVETKTHEEQVVEAKQEAEAKPVEAEGEKNDTASEQPKSA